MRVAQEGMHGRGGRRHQERPPPSYAEVKRRCWLGRFFIIIFVVVAAVVGVGVVVGVDGWCWCRW